MLGNALMLTAGVVVTLAIVWLAPMAFFLVLAKISPSINNPQTRECCLLASIVMPLLLFVLEVGRLVLAQVVTWVTHAPLYWPFFVALVAWVFFFSPYWTLRWLARRPRR